MLCVFCPLLEDGSSVIFVVISMNPKCACVCTCVCVCVIPQFMNKLNSQWVELVETKAFVQL